MRRVRCSSRTKRHHRRRASQVARRPFAFGAITVDSLTVDVWVGLFSSRERLEKYLEEIYDDDDSTPLSEFAGDMDEFFYDHDFFESSF
ncbi:hypothetical protein EON83_18745 [bacterium]|nr:MAG: hypothetical protein EON83_18745 [bacterium]